MQHLEICLSTDNFSTTEAFIHRSSTLKCQAGKKKDEQTNRKKTKFSETFQSLYIVIAVLYKKCSCCTCFIDVLFMF